MSEKRVKQIRMLKASKQLAADGWKHVNQIDDESNVNQIEYEKTNKKYNEIQHNLDSVPWYRLIKRRNIKRLLQAEGKDLRRKKIQIKQTKDELDGAKEDAAKLGRHAVNLSGNARRKVNLVAAERISQELHQSPNINTLKKWLSNPPIV